MNLIAMALSAATSILSPTEVDADIKNVHGISVLDINNQEINLADYEGKVLLIVNVASKCGFTKQYKGLQALYDQYKDEGLEILGFPCNDFGAQEPGTNEEIVEFCSLNFGVEFKMFDKVKVLGEDKHPLFSILTNNPVTGNSNIKWNFEKFVIGRDGNVVERFRSNVTPDDKKLVEVINNELGK